ncbi:Archaeal/vacuolar-type H+-ATPase subunit E [Archaeoglobus sulfaticallidus PM70-1]|uniref:A-type ATP synthase subunit E n=1 Tax=Archaeoglobus sulfaticallidus PM70-1 TaxID=387631 RepID=N0BET3_9EURY|nr:V-type ATP synthase subunit E [Archaeoglobus sulfaticallidus]AGK62149.1 Archaeal/vacuolar-type H+-ATPase subunit E [Archaeoglobus sulfaticallidus PM70-1]
MPLEPVIEEIVKKGQQRVSEIKSEAEKEVEKIVVEAEEKAKEILKKARDTAENEVERLRKQEISSINLEMKREELNRRKEVLEAVYEKLVEKVKSMDKEEKKKLMEKLLKANEKEGYRVYSNKEDEEIVKSISKMEYAGNIECIGGVVLESADGQFRINLTFDEMLSTLFESKMKEVSEILFK